MDWCVIHDNQSIHLLVIEKFDLIDMKKLYLTLLLAGSLTTAFAQDHPGMKTMDLTAAEMAHYMAPGWNLGNTLEAGNSANNFTNNAGTASETAWQSTKTTQQVLDAVKAQGFKSVRIPCAWVMGHISDKAAMTIDPAWTNRVKEIIDYCINAGLYVVINDHWDGGWLEYDGFTTGADVSAKKEQLRKLWTNIANALKDYDERVIFAGLNEPGVGGASPDAKGKLMLSNPWSPSDADLTKFTDRLIDYENVFVDAVRATGGNNAKRVLVVQGPMTTISHTVKHFDASRINDMAKDRLMVEIHSYEPYNFCQNTDASSAYYYWVGHAPKRATHISSTSDEQSIKDNFASLNTAFVDKGYPVILGEYGAIRRTLSSSEGTQAKHDESRKYWYQLVTAEAMQDGVIPFVWDTNATGSNTMTIVNRRDGSVFDQFDLDGITAGASEAKEDYEGTYPAPSTTSISLVSAEKCSEGTVYDLCGRAVKNHVSSFREANLPRGIYLFQGKKYVKD